MPVSAIVISTARKSAVVKQGDRGKMYEDRFESEITSPIDARRSPGLVRRVLASIDDMSREGADVLLSDLLCAAWPTPRAQAQ
jgi:hypothetical protein